MVQEPQSSGQLALDSSPSHTRSPQHEVIPSAGIEVQEKPLVLQRASEQETGFGPSPSPQQKRLLGLPLVLPLQSDGHDRQSSPSPASQIPLPQLAPGVVKVGQSAAHELQSSPLSQSPLPQTAGQPVQAEKSKPSQVALQLRVPPAQPKSPQVCPPVAEPSQTSPVSITPLPHSCEQESNLNDATRVDHCAAELYSPVNQNVQSSAGSTLIDE